MSQTPDFVSVTIFSPASGFKGSDKLLEVLARTLKRSVEDVRVRLETGQITLPKVVHNENLTKLITLLKRGGFTVTTKALGETPTVQQQPPRPEKTSKTVRVFAAMRPRTQTDWKKGDLIEGLYEVLGSASGGMGTVYFIFHRMWKMNMAIKTPQRAGKMTDTKLLRFLREAELWVDLGLHPNIATCYYARVIDGLPRLFIEYVDGGDLDIWHEKKRLTDLRIVLDLMLQFCHGIMYSHERGLIHRDIKPANCLITRDRILKITDFGLVKRLEEAPVEHTEEATPETSRPPTDSGLTLFEGGVVGSPWYMAPERFKLGMKDDIRSDIYSFGVMLYEILLDRRPFVLPKGAGLTDLVRCHLRAKPLDPLSIRPDLPLALAEIMLTCLEKKPEKRYPSFAEVLEALEDACRVAIPDYQPRPRPNLVELKADSLNNQAVSLLDMGREEEARQLLEDAHSANTDHLEAVYNLYVLRWKRAEISDREVVNRLESLKIEARETADAQHLTGLVALQRGEAAKGVALLTRACQGAQHYAERWQDYSGNPKDYVSSLGLSPIGEETSFAGHVKRVSALALPPSMKRALSVGEDRTLRVWDIGTGRCLKNIRTFNFTPITGAFSPDGHLAATGYGEAFKTLDVWDIDQGRLLRRHQGMAVERVCFSADARFLAAAETKGHVKVMDAYLERSFWEYDYRGPKITAMAFGKNRGVLILGGEDGSLTVIDGESASPLFREAAHRGRVSWLQLSEDKGFCLSGGEDGIVRIWEADTGKEVQRFTGHHGTVVGAHVLPDDTFVVSITSDGLIKIWDKQTGRCFRTIVVPGEELTSSSLSADGKRLVTGGARGSVRLWSIDTGWFFTDFLEPAICQPRTFRELSILHDTFNYSVDDFREAWKEGQIEEALRVFDRIRNMPGFCWTREAVEIRNTLGAVVEHDRVKSWAFIRSFYGHKDVVVSLDALPDSLFLLTGSLDGSAGLWDVVTGRCLKRFQTPAPVEKVLFLHAFRGLLTWSTDEVLRRWDLEGNRIWECPGVSLPLALTPDGRELMALTGGNAPVRLNLETGAHVFQGPAIPGHPFVSFSARLLSLYSVRDGTKIQRWSAQTGRNEGSFRDLGTKISVLAPTASDDRVIGAMESGEVMIYIVGSGVNVATLRGHTERVGVIASARDPRLWVTGSDDCTLRLWDVADERCLATFEGHASAVRAACVFPNLSLIASAGSEGSVRLWGVEWELTPPGDLGRRQKGGS